MAAVPTAGLRAQEVSPPEAPHSSADSAAPGAAAFDAAASARADLEQLQAMLNDPAARQEQRDEAARRLVSRQNDPARQMLHKALTDEGNVRSQLAVARALVFDEHPDDRFIDPLFSLLGSDKTLADAAAQALSTYRNDPNVLSRLLNRAADPNQNVAGRCAATRAIGTFPEKRAAQVLVTLATQASNPAPLRDAANSALSDLTGLASPPDAPRRWDQWWAEQANQSDAEFKAALLNHRAARYSQAEYQQAQLVEELQAILRDQYRVSQNKPETLLRYLHSAEPAVRLVGAQIILADLQNAVPPSASAREQLRRMIGDSSTAVRLQVAKTLSAINDSAAFEPLLTQLAQEPDADVRAALVLALKPIGNLRAVPELLQLLRDPAPNVAEAACQAIQEVGDKLREQNPDLAAEAGQLLIRIITIRTSPGDSGLRDAAVEALGPLHAAGTLRILAPLLKSSESVAVRRAALHALGDLGDSRAQDLIVLNALDDKDRDVRLAAATALETTATFASAEPLYSHLKDPDERVRSASWRVLESLFPSFPADVLYNWQDRFTDQPDRLFILQRALADMYLKAKDLDRLARVQQNLGKTLMDLKQPAEAAVYFGKALDHWIAVKQNMLTQGLIRQNMDALLRSKQYHEATGFAADMIKRNLSDQQTMGPMIRDEASRLADSADDAAAMQLITEANQMNPPLDRFFLDSLADIQRKVKQRTQKSDSTTGPRSAADGVAHMMFASAHSPEQEMASQDHEP
jgi:HEAT repeat protein